jgi:hypothetical protein
MFESRWALTGRGRLDKDVLEDRGPGSSISIFGLPPSSDGREEDGWRAWDVGGRFWYDGFRGTDPGRDVAVA